MPGVLVRFHVRVNAYAAVGDEGELDAEGLSAIGDHVVELGAAGRTSWLQ